MYNIMIWGTGMVSKQLEENNLNGNILGYIETNKTKSMYNGKSVYSPWEVPAEYDYIIVANNYINEVYATIQQNNIDLDKVIFMQLLKKNIGVQNSKVISDILGEKNFHIFCKEKLDWTISFMKQDLEEYTLKNTRENFDIKRGEIDPYLNDKYGNAGCISEYFWQDLWAAKLVRQSKVKEHYDIGSSVIGFIAHVLAMNIKVNMIDVRPFPYRVKNLSVTIADATNMSHVEDGSIESLSALCSLEHFGLGRYGDPIDPEACFKCFEAIQRKMKQGGNLYIAVPVGRERVRFNEARIFSIKTIIDSFPQMELVEFSYAHKSNFYEAVDINLNDEIKKIEEKDTVCGLFFFRKNNR